MSGTYHYKKIRDYILKEIATGRVAPGGKILSQRQLCEHFGVSKAPVLKALDSMINEGTLFAVKGKGVFVSHSRSRSPKSHLKNGSAEVALLIPSFSDYYRAIVNALERSLFANGVALRIYLTEYNSEREQLFIKQTINDDSVLGIIASAEASPDKMQNFYPQLFKKINKPFLLVNRPVQNHDYDCIHFDYYRAGQILTEQLLQMGCQRFIFHGVLDDNYSWIPRRQAILDCLNKAGIERLELLSALILPPQVKRFSHLLKEFKPDAIICAGGNLLEHMSDLLEAFEVKVPEDVVLGSCDGNAIETTINIPIEIAEIPKEQVGVIAAETILAKINGDSSFVNIVIEPRLGIRNSINYHANKSSRTIKK
jgi:GntR family transcriptional regulator, arabinose operon transcriptional repressor